MTATLIVFHLLTYPLGLNRFIEEQTEPPPHYFRMRIYVFEGLKEKDEPLGSELPEIVVQALEQVGKVMKFSGFRNIDAIAWQVIAKGDMDRFLDIPEKWWSLAENTQISFKLIYNYNSKFLSLHDFRFMINQVPKLQTSVGVRDGGAVVLGHSTIGSEEKVVFFVLTLEVSDTLFPEQDPNAVFTVIMATDHKH